MLICNEGPPRAGKTYDVMLSHILPALQAGRRVYARVNGLDHAAIAAHLGIPLADIERNLIHVPTEDVLTLFAADGDDPPRFKIDANSLVVIDEVHEFYVASRVPLPKEQATFFAKHGHIGLDVIVMTQAIEELHTSIRRRIERKNIFVKLNALGDENKYVIRFYSVGSKMGRFEPIGSERREYDPAIFPLYKGFQPEVTNTGAYKAGSKTVWSVIKKPAIFMGLALIVAVIAIGAFFTGDTGLVEEKATAAVPADTEVYPLKGEVTPPPSDAGVAVGASPIGRKTPAQPVDDDAKYPPAIRHVIELGRSARPRFSGTIGSRYLLEWRTPQGNAIERMTSDQVEAMGWHLVREAYGVVATYADRTVLFTAWPIDPVFTQSSATTQRIQQAAGGQGTAPLVSSAAMQGQGQGSGQGAPAGGGVIQAQQLTGYGGIGYGGTSAGADTRSQADANDRE